MPDQYLCNEAEFLSLTSAELAQHRVVRITGSGRGTHSGFLNKKTVEKLLAAAPAAHLAAHCRPCKRCSRVISVLRTSAGCGLCRVTTQPRAPPAPRATMNPMEQTSRDLQTAGQSILAAAAYNAGQRALVGRSGWERFSSRMLDFFLGPEVAQHPFLSHHADSMPFPPHAPNPGAAPNPVVPNPNPVVPSVRRLQPVPDLCLDGRSRVRQDLHMILNTTVVMGGSGSGKTETATSLLAELAPVMDHAWACLVCPEGTYRTNVRLQEIFAPEQVRV